MLPAPHPYRCLSSWRAAWYFHPLPSPTLPFRQPLIETNANTSPSLIGRPPPLLSLFHPGSYLSSNVVELDRKPGPFLSLLPSQVELSPRVRYTTLTLPSNQCSLWTLFSLFSTIFGGVGGVTADMAHSFLPPQHIRLSPLRRQE